MLKMRKFRNFKHHNSSRMMILVTPAIILPILFCHSYYIWHSYYVSIPHNYVSTLSLSFVYESGTLPSTDANPDNLGEYAVSLGRDTLKTAAM